MRARFLKQHNPFVDRKESRIMLLIIECHRNNQFVEQCAGPLDHVQVPVRDWIKAAGIDGDAHGRG
jgi:hypothetical protein